MDKFAELWQQPSFEKIAEWVNINSNVFLLNALGNNSNYRYLYNRIVNDFRIEVTYLEGRWSEVVSNNHSAPFGKRTNWGGRVKDAPRGYPGWQGSISFTMSHEVPSFTTNMFNNTGINIGSGGGGGLKFQYTVELFEDDWPGLAKSRTLDILSQK